MNLSDIKKILQEPEWSLLDSSKNTKFKSNRNAISILKTKFPYLKDREILYLKKHEDNLENLHIFCDTCGRKLIFDESISKYRLYCSQFCKNSNKIYREKLKISHRNEDGSYKNNRIKYALTCNMKYGVSNPMKLDNVKQKSRCTKNSRYGDPNYNNPLKNKKTCLKRVGVDCYNKLPKYKKNLSNYWKDENWKCNNIKNNKRSKFINHGDENWNNRPKSECTNIIRYGVKYFPKSKQYKDLYKNKEWVEEKQRKWYQTRKKNGYNYMSLPEQIVSQYLIQIFPDLEYIHKDSLYPFNCDFYIPSRKLYIEINFTYEHHNEEFDPKNPNHIKEINHCLVKSKQLKESHKYKNRYLNKIYIWTDLDPRKRQVAAESGINYKYFYNYKDFYSWYITLTPDM